MLTVGRTIFTKEVGSPVGNLLLRSDETHLVGLWMDRQKNLETVMGKMLQPGGELPVLKQAEEWLRAYFAKEQPNPKELPLAPVGSEFQQCIWNFLLEIPYGELTTYGDLAKKAAKQLGKEKMSAQAVGGAVGHNPLGIIIPCHRVVGKDGNLTGYAGGIDKKVWLLAHEGVETEKLHRPKERYALL